MDNDRQPIVPALLPLMRAALGKVETRELSGATGFYLDGILFGIFSGGALRFRVDRQTSTPYDAWEQSLTEEEEGEDTRDMFSRAIPSGGGLKFRVVPPFVLDSEDSMAEWGKRAWEAAKRDRNTQRN